MMDKYDEQIDQLMSLSPEAFEEENYPDSCYQQWSDARGLFQMICPNGCPTMVKNKLSRGDCLPGDLLERIQKDPLIPSSVSDIRQDRQQLEAFANYQREIDELVESGEHYR